MSVSKETLLELLSQVDIEVNGTRPWDITIHNDQVFQRTLAQGSLGFGESYMDGWWDCEALDQMLTKVFNADIEKSVRSWKLLGAVVTAKLFNQQSKSKAFEIGEQHYDVGNDLYTKMLDDRMVYTCGYWEDANTLNEAQEAKLELICKKIGLKKGMRLLDIGCGWGSFIQYAAEKYGAECIGVTVSKEQVDLANRRLEETTAKVQLMDYRDITGKFDRVVSLGMFEHVGVRNYKTFMSTVDRVLDAEGVFLLHTIGGLQSVNTTDPWIEKYIFTNSMLPSSAQITEAIEGTFILEDWHNFGTDYDKTLLEWHKNFLQAWPELQDQYSDRFKRMWEFYLLSSAASFRSRKNQLWQIVLKKQGSKKPYRSLR